MKKIALNFIYLSKHHAGGKDQVGLNLLKGFQDLGVTDQFFVICFDYLEETILEIAPGIEVYPIRAHRQGNDLFQMAYLSYVNTIKIPAILRERNAKAIYHLSYINGLRRFKIPSLMIPHDIKAVSHRVLGKVKVSWFKYWIYRVIYRLDFSHADVIVAISDFDKEEIAAYYPRYQEKIHRIYNPVIVQGKMNHPDKEYKQDNKKYITALNIQFHHKNTITLIRAFQQIKDQMEHDLILIGKVPSRMQYLIDYVKRNHLDDRIHFTGFILEEKMAEYFINSDLYVNPTLYEGFGMTAVEAIIYQVPTLVSKVASNYEVTMGLCHYYEPADDVFALAEAIRGCLDSPTDSRLLREYSEKIHAQYDYIKSAQEYMNLFQDTIGNKKDSHYI